MKSELSSTMNVEETKQKSRHATALLFAVVAIPLCALSTACDVKNEVRGVLPRNQNLPLFKPHVPTFACNVEASKVPPIDAQAEAWFQEARALENPELYEHDYKSIVQLTRQAAERHHWKAMLNLASLYLEQRDPTHGVEDAVQLVEQAMLLGIPAAYDRMGTYHMNGTGVAADATMAYAFWQKAAAMGNPQAMEFLADKMDAGKDSDGPGHWANIPVATKMLECAFGQGYGPAAFNLHFLYASPRTADGKIVGPPTRETKALAIKTLHEGVRFGCEDCANKLAIEFGDPFDLADMLAPFVDKARGTRYAVFGDALGFDPSSRFPNLDKVLPLPPAPLPPWNGDRDTLLHAAMGIAPPRQVLEQPHAMGRNRFFVPPGYALRRTGQTTTARVVPFEAYWWPSAPPDFLPVPDELANCPPGLYLKDESFHLFPVAAKHGWRYLDVIWERCLTVPCKRDEVAPQAPKGLALAQPRPNDPLRRNADDACPATGIWQPWVHADHPMSAIVNQYWRQAWLLEGQAFPQPRRDWLLDLPAQDLTWHLMDASAVDING